MRHSRITRRLIRFAALGRRSARRIAGREECSAPVASWRTESSPAGAVALVGDSLASRFPQPLLEAVHPRILQRGWAGETAVALRDRIDEVLERRPAVILLQTGTNDLLRGATTTQLLTTYAALLDDIRATAPDAAIAILSLPPVTAARLNPRTIRASNAGLRTLAQDLGATFVDTYAALTATDGTPAHGITTDGVHLTGHGYRLVADALRSVTVRTADPDTHLFPLTLSHQT